MTRPARAAAAALVLVACSDQGGRAPEVHETGAPPVSASASPDAAKPPSTLAGGQSLTGAVSGLQGLITGFTVRQTETQTIVELATDVLFAFDSAELAPEATGALNRTAELIRAGGAGEIRIVGHTDSMGEEAYNQQLSLRRASTVAEWLSSTGGVDFARLRPEGRGEAEPAAPNARPDGQDDPEGRARNRRVVVAIPR